MRSRRTAMLFLTALALGVPGRAVAEDPKGTERVTGLIQQLGNGDFAQREAAARALDALGREALAPLRRAAASEDAEVRRRASDLAEQIEKRLESLRLLEPKRFRLVYKDTPLGQAVADFARKTGFLLQLGAVSSPGRPAVKPSLRTLTLDTGEVPFWDAFDQFCRRAGLVEQSLVPKAPAPVSVRDAERAKIEMELRVIRQQRQAIFLQSGGQQPQPCVVVDGKVPALATCLAGPIRIRALPADIHPAGSGRAEDEVQFTLEVTPAPGLNWLNFGNLRIDRAVDERGKTLTPVLDVPNAPNEPDDWSDVLIVQDVLNEVGQGSASHHLPVRLKLDKDSAKKLRELRGTISAQVQTPPEPLMKVDDVVKAVGQAVNGPDGHALKVLEAERRPDGELKLRVEVQTPSPAGMRGMVFVRGARFLRVNNGQMVIMDSAGSSTPKGLAVQDAAGKNLPVTRMETRTSQRGNELVQEYQLSCKGPANATEPARLVYTGQRTTVIQVPFTLTDVPLP